MGKLIFGAETEYAITGISSRREEIESEELAAALLGEAHRRYLFLPDMNSGHGMFLSNGSRFYLDGSHPEVATPECSNPWDVVRYIEAGHEILRRLTDSKRGERRRRREVLLLRNNVDLSGSYTDEQGQATWAFHESFLYRNSHDVLRTQLVPHLATRAIYTGAGGFDPFSPGLRFVLSPRATFVRELSSDGSTGEYRSLWHTKNEPLSAHYKRLHVLSGESLCSHRANWLRFGVTSLLVAMADAGLKPGKHVQLVDPLKALHTVVADRRCKAELSLRDGGTATAIEIQRRYMEELEPSLLHECMPPWAGEVCVLWRETLDKLETDPASLGHTLDWAIKDALYAHRAREIGIDWETLPQLNELIESASAPLIAGPGVLSADVLERAIATTRTTEALAALEPLLAAHGFTRDDLNRMLSARAEFFEIETRFSQLGEKGIFRAMEHAGVLSHRIRGVDNIEHAMETPPASGRALIRGQETRRLAGTPNVRCDWECIVDFDRKKLLDLSEPFAETAEWKELKEDDRTAPHVRGRFAEMASLFAELGSGRPNPQMQREQAYECYVRGDYGRAEELLRECIDALYDVPGNLCHLARVLVHQDREAEARDAIARAWEVRNDGPEYARARIVFFQLLFAMLDRRETSETMRQIRAELEGTQSRMSWTIQPMLDHLEERIRDEDLTFLNALAGALGERGGMSALEQFASWRMAAGVDRARNAETRVC